VGILAIYCSSSYGSGGVKVILLISDEISFRIRWHLK
jgi:hypothetical protein